MIPVEASKAYPDSIEPGVIARACAPDAVVLQRFLAQRNAPAFEALIRPWKGYAACHILYEPSIPRFRGSPDDEPIEGLHIGVDPLGFFVGRRPIGDTLDVAKQVLAELPPSIELTITVRGDFPSTLWEDAVKQHFGESGRRIRVRASDVIATHPWAQDYVKAGELNGKRVLVTPWRLFEGRAEDGPHYLPLLEGLQRDGALHSRLSWDGGDIQFVRSPNRPNEILLAHGGASRDYWGDQLDALEHSFVLAREFGADQALDLSTVGPHADYLVAFLPQDRIALVSRPVYDDPRLLEAASRALLELLGSDRAPRLAALVRELATWDRNLDGRRAELVAALNGVIDEALALEPKVDAATLDELYAYADRACPGNPEPCTRDEHAPALFAAEPNLLRRIADEGAAIKAHTQLVPALLGLMQAQLAGPPVERMRDLDVAAADLRQSGFKVIRVPYLTAPEIQHHWPGVSYVNLLAYERTLFVPRFGLGDYEEEIYRNLRRKLGEAYTIKPVDARASVAGNGGVHCAFGILRRVSPGPRS